MNKIKTKKDAQALVDKMVATGEEIVLWDEVNSSRAMKVEADAEFGLWCVLTFTDGVTGMVDVYKAYRAEAVEAIFTNRKNVNKLNELENF